MKHIRPLIYLFLLAYATLTAQIPTDFQTRKEAFTKKISLQEQSVVNGIPFESIGPTIFGGRITDVDFNPNRQNELFVAYASGGLWYSNNLMASATPIFDNEMVMTIGDIAVNWQDSVIWVGTGEVNSSRSSFAGNGVYKSLDWGKTWQHMGLEETQHIGRVVLHPTDENVAWVAALGRLYSSNPERGVFKTTDGGKSWTKSLFINDSTGVVDLVIDPNNPNTIYAAAWERERKAWDFKESGSGSGIYRSTDGGDNWTLLTTKNSGFPTGDGVGRIGIDVYNDGEKEVLYAILDNYNRLPKTTDELTIKTLQSMSSAAFLKLPVKKLETFWKQNNLEKSLPLDSIRMKIQRNEITPTTLYEYLWDGQSQLFETPVIGCEIYSSTDGGKHWRKTHEEPLDKVYFSYGYYFGQIKVSPHDANTIYFAGVPALKSTDGGQSFVSLHYANMHVDHHSIWVHPSQKDVVAFGNDGGLNLSYDGGTHFERLRNPPVGQFYSISLDNQEPFNIYGGLQDNGVWKGPSNYTFSTAWEQEGEYPYKRLLGGDGMQTMIDSRNPTIVYTGFQFGYYYRLNLVDGTRTFIQPKHSLGEKPYRFNWQTPILLSSHNQDILYLGGNKVFRSMNQGNTWQAISEDLTKSTRSGDVPYGTITCIAESSATFGDIYVGTDDGLLHHTSDGGHSWKQINQGIPPDLWVTKIELSTVLGRVYVSLSGYRSDDFKAYLYVSDDNGKNWKSLSEALPNEPINVIEEDPNNSSILYVGTDHGLYVSMDGGKTFVVWNKGLPAVSIHDIEIHASGTIVIGTHGRSIYKADTEPIHKYLGASEALTFLTDSLSIKHNENWGSFNPFTTSSEPTVHFFIKSPKAQTINWVIANETDKEVWQASQKIDKGINQVAYNLQQKVAIGTKTENKPSFLNPGRYKIALKNNNTGKKIELVVKE